MVNRRIIDQAEATSLTDSDYLVADNVNLGTRKIQFTRLLSGSTPLPPNYMTGFKIKKIDNNTFSVDSGNARSVDNLRNMQLQTSLNKNISLSFDLGSDAGCMPSNLTLQASTKYYIFLISNPSGLTDIIIDTDENCANGLEDDTFVLNNFDKFVLLGYLNTNENSYISNIYYKTAGVLIESYSDENSWYKLYADNWLEQGGIITSETYSATPVNFQTTITFKKQFKNNNYFKIITPLTDFAWNVLLQQRNSSFTDTGATLYFNRVSNTTAGVDRFLQYSYEFKGFAK